MDNYAAQLKRKLEEGRVRMVYRDADGLRPQLVTTLDSGVVASWLGTTEVEAAVERWADWFSPSSMGYMSLPDLAHRGRFVSVPILHIEKLEGC